ncbi:hypothetical protein ACIGXM_14480 [Kitasatospora sp. NPDC052896]|uniref:hypothetical protein n=1 Tax=Kitasatospora sp. NPDC052896 TaxID=3364061 RepID=UPI0037CAA79E
MTLVDQVKADLKSAHLQEQAGRVVRLTTVAFGAQLVTLGTDHLGWKAVAGAAVGAIEAAYRQWAPTIPWAAVAARLHVLDALRPAASSPAPAPTNTTNPPTAN